MCVHPSVCASIRPSPPCFVSFGAHIQTLWPKSKQYSPSPSQMVQIWLEQVAQGQYVVSDTRCPALRDCELEGGGSRAAAPKGTKSCRTQGDFRSSCLRKGMRCYRGLTKGLQEPKLRSKKVDIRPKNANWKLERADLRLGRAGSKLEIRGLI